MELLRRLLPTRRRLAAYGLAFAALVLAKTLWVLAARVDGARLLRNEELSDVLERRAYLARRIREDGCGLGNQPSSLPPRFQGEWAVGTLSMTAIALANVAFLHPETRDEARALLCRVVDQALAPERRRFDVDAWGEDPLASLAGPGGHIGYLAHLDLMVLAELYLGGCERHGRLADDISAALERRLGASPILNLETYPGEIYVMDNSVVVAALALHARLRGRGLPGPALSWLEHARERLLDPATGLLCFSVGPDGRPTQGSRGSGATWAVFYLWHADPAFAAGQFTVLKAKLLSRALGVIPGFREFPAGVEGDGDVDSGPIILGLSPSGTGFAVAGARLSGDAPLLGDLLWTAEVAGFTWASGGERWYLLAPLVGDAIMLAMRTATPWDLRWAGPGPTN